MSAITERTQQYRRELADAMTQIRDRRAELLGRLTRLVDNGAVPEDAAIEKFTEAVDRLAEDGRKAVTATASEFLSARNHPAADSKHARRPAGRPPDLNGMLGRRADGTLGSLISVIAFLCRDQLIEAGTAAIREARAAHPHRHVGSPNERAGEIADIERQIDELDVELAAVDQELGALASDIEPRTARPNGAHVRQVGEPIDPIDELNRQRDEREAKRAPLHDAHDRARERAPVVRRPSINEGTD